MERISTARLRLILNSDATKNARLVQIPISERRRILKKKERTKKGEAERFSERRERQGIFKSAGVLPRVDAILASPRLRHFVCALTTGHRMLKR